LTLGGKLVAQEGTLSRTINLLFQYVLNMARYDLDYNVRDRARFLRALVYGSQNGAAAATEQDIDDQESEPEEQHAVEGGSTKATGGFEYSEKELNLSEHVKAILLSEKEAPIQENPSHGREQYKVGSMSLVLNRVVAGYEPLPDWPTTQPDPSVRRLAATMEAPGYMNDRTGFGSDSVYAQSRQGQGNSNMSSSGGMGSSRYDGQTGAYRGAETLDKFLESSEEESTDSDEDSSSESESESEESSAAEGSSDGDEDEEGSDEDEEEGDDDDEEEASSSEEEAILPTTVKRSNRRK